MLLGTVDKDARTFGRLQIVDDMIASRNYKVKQQAALKETLDAAREDLGLADQPPKKKTKTASVPQAIDITVTDHKNDSRIVSVLHERDNSVLFVELTAVNVVFLHLYFSAKLAELKTRPQVQLPARENSGHHNVWWAPKYLGYRVRYHDGDAWRQRFFKVAENRTREEALTQAVDFQVENCKAEKDE